MTNRGHKYLTDTSSWLTRACYKVKWADLVSKWKNTFSSTVSWAITTRKNQNKFQLCCFGSMKYNKIWEILPLPVYILLLQTCVRAQLLNRQIKIYLLTYSMQILPSICYALLKKKFAWEIEVLFGFPHIAERLRKMVVYTVNTPMSNYL